MRKLAAVKLAQEKPGQTLDATALVHEAYMRMVGGAHQSQFAGRGHFFAAAAEAMHRILIDKAQRNAASSKAAVWSGRNWIHRACPLRKPQRIFWP